MTAGLKTQDRIVLLPEERLHGSEKTWCLDCFERREPWVIRVLMDNGAHFRHHVLEEAETCLSCREPLPLGTHVMIVSHAVSRVADGSPAIGTDVGSGPVCTE